MADEAPFSPRPLPDLIGGRYRIVSRLGVGGMGVVYKANDLQLNRAVAVKALEERRMNIPGAASRLKTEALAAASLDHPYICKVYELVETSTDTYIVMEYVEGETLASMLKRGVLPLAQTLQLGREIAEGLANAHARGLVHRDVKPSNVMVTTHGHVKLLDFGVAGADVSSTTKEVTHTLAPQLTIHAGTPQYMAPEQAAGQPITTRADLFSLGVVLYECLTGQLPFSGSTTFDYVRHVMQSPPRRLDKVAPETPSDLVDLIDRCLEKTPADRPESAEAIVAALRRLEDQMTAPAGGVRTARQARAGRRWKWIAAAAVVVAAIALGWQFLAPGAPSEVPRQLRPFVTTSAVEFGSRISPGGEWLSFIATAAGTSRIMVQRIDGGEARPLTLGPGQPFSQLWSPDGGQIAAVLLLDGAYVLQVYPAFFGGAPVLSIPIVAPAPGATSGAPLKINSVDLLRWIGRDIYLQLNIQNEQSVVVSRIPIDSPSAATVITGAWKVDGNIRSVDVRPDGRSAVLSVIKGSQQDLWTANLDGSGLRQLTADAFFDKEPRWLGRGDLVVFQSNRGGQIDLWEINVRTQELTSLTSGEAEEVPESSSPDGRVITFRQMTKDANLWAFLNNDAGQLTQDSLSDYSPVLSGDGRSIAFQRSQPTPSQGYAILDAKVFVAPFDGRQAIDARPVADGFAANLSEDGHWLAYLQRGDRVTHMTLSVRDLRAGATTIVSRSAALPRLSIFPVEWSTRLTAWSRSGNDLYFVDDDDGYTIRRYRAGDAAPGPPLAKAPDNLYPRDLEVSAVTGRLGYVLTLRDTAIVQELDPATGAVRDIVTLKGQNAGLAITGRGWLEQRYVLIRSVRSNEDRTSDIEVLLTNDLHGATVVGRIGHVFTPTIRLHAPTRALYFTGSEKGTHNVYAFSLDKGTLTAVTQNALPGVTFSGFQALRAGGILGVREERREDIWLIEQVATPRSGNPAGR